MTILIYYQFQTLNKLEIEAVEEDSRMVTMYTDALESLADEAKARNAAYGQFKQVVKVKAVCAGARFVQVKPTCADCEKAGEPCVFLATHMDRDETKYPADKLPVVAEDDYDDDGKVWLALVGCLRCQKSKGTCPRRHPRHRITTGMPVMAETVHVEMSDLLADISAWISAYQPAEPDSDDDDEEFTKYATLRKVYEKAHLALVKLDELMTRAVIKEDPKGRGKKREISIDERVRNVTSKKSRVARDGKAAGRSQVRGVRNAAAMAHNANAAAGPSRNAAAGPSRNAGAGSSSCGRALNAGGPCRRGPCPETAPMRRSARHAGNEAE